MGDISYRKLQFDKAAHHFSQLLMSQPYHWAALVRLIQTKKRLGQIKSCYIYLENAEKSSIDSAKPLPGLIYCKGLHAWSCYKLQIALHLFNQLRYDCEWGALANNNMIEIYVNLDEDIMYVSHNDNYVIRDKTHMSESHLAGLHTAERLIQQSLKRCNDVENEVYNLQLFQNLLQIASNDVERITATIKNVHDLHMCDEIQSKVGYVYALALGYLKLKNLTQAKVLLKKMLHTAWSFEESIFLERCWLLLAFIYMQEQDYDEAMELLQRILQMDCSHIKAYELAGYIAEKCNMYKEACIYYLNAWNYGFETNAFIGYKLAFCYMKTKSYAEGVNICQLVLKIHPDFTAIKHDILEKCRNNLRK